MACKEINVGGWRGWRLRVVEAFIIILAFTQTIYVLLLHSGFYRGSYGDDTGYGGTAVPGAGYGGTGAGYGGGVAGAQPVPKSGATGTMV